MKSKSNCVHCDLSCPVEGDTPTTRWIITAVIVLGWTRVEKSYRSTSVHAFATRSADSRLKTSSHSTELSGRSPHFSMIHRILWKCSSKLVRTRCIRRYQSSVVCVERLSLSHSLWRRRCHLLWPAVSMHGRPSDFAAGSFFFPNVLLGERVRGSWRLCAI